MTHVRQRILIRSALIPVAALLGLGAAAPSFAGAPAAASRPSYTMRLNPATATVRPGASATTKISFRGSRSLYDTAVDLSVSGLPAGVTATFSPPKPRISGRSVLTLTAAPSATTGAFALTVTAITISSDPIGTSAGFTLAIGATPSWPQFGHDPQLTGANPDEKTITRDTVGGLSLEYVAVGPVDPNFGGISRSSPAVVGDVAYVGTDAGQLLAWPATGCGGANCRPLWTAQLSNGVFTTPAVAGGLVFVSSAGSVDNGLGKLYAFKAAGCGRATCGPLWTAPVPNVGSSPTVSDGVVYIVSSDGRLLAFAAAGCGRATCTPLWSGTMKSSAEAAPAVAHGLVYATSSDRLLAFHAGGCGQPTCAPVWASIPVAGSDTGAGLIQGVGPTVSGDKVYFASVDFADPDGKTGTVYAYSSTGCSSTRNMDCTPLWIAHPSDFDTVGTLTVSGGVLYGGAVGFLFAFDANGCGRAVCSFLWFGILPGTIAGTGAAPSVAGGVVYYTQNNGQIGGFDAGGCGQLECTPLWSTVTQPDEAFMTTPVITGGRLYVAGPAVNQQPTMWVYHLAG
jgi:PQQ-like domain